MAYLGFCLACLFLVALDSPQQAMICKMDGCQTSTRHLLCGDHFKVLPESLRGQLKGRKPGALEAAITALGVAEGRRAPMGGWTQIPGVGAVRAGGEHGVSGPIPQWDDPYSNSRKQAP